MLRRGMWVKDGSGRIGIVNAFDAAGVEFHVVDGKGETVQIEIVPASKLRQAALKDIPAARRPTKERGAFFGYR
jgi:hypothetical protein